MEIKIIQDYILYLIKECGLSISLHPIGDETLITCSPLMNFNIHNNAYCSYIKSLPNGHMNCLAHQKKIFNQCCKKAESFCEVCYAGVSEYVFPIHDERNILSFISVSGYDCDNKEQYISSISKKFNCCPESVSNQYDKLKTDMPTKSRIETLILPLCKMLEFAYIKEAKESTPASLNEAICRYIQRHYSIDLTTEHICKEFSCSKSYFSHNFKNYTGQTFREYLTNIRLNYAKQLLEHSDLSVTQISFSIGFNDSNYFSNIFKQKTGLSPLMYRKKQKKEYMLE